MALKIHRKTRNSNNVRRRQASGVIAPYAYSSKRSEDNLPIGRNNSKVVQTARFGLKRFGLIVLSIAIVIALIKLFSISNTPIIRVAGTNNNTIFNETGTSLYQKAAKTYLASSIWNNNKLTVDSSGLARYLQNRFPELADVNVNMPFADNHLVVYLAPTKPVIIITESSSKAFALDSSGRAILESANVSTLKLNLPVVTDQNNLSLSLGKMALTSSDVYFVEEIVGQLKAKGYTISQMTLPANTEELDASLAGQPYYIKFNLADNNPRQQAGTFLATMAYLASHKQSPTKYVDVRVAGRAYYE